MENHDDYAERSKGFSSEIGQAIGANDIKEIECLMTSNAYPRMTKEEKEHQTLVSAYIAHNKKVIKFLIFDYGIKEEYFIETCQNMNEVTIDILNVAKLSEEVKHMFAIRNLNNELSNTLSNGKQRKPGTKL
jgi:hypothetical protein